MLPAAILFDLDDTLISPHLHRKTFWNDAIRQVWDETNDGLETLPKNIDVLVQQIDKAAQVFWSDPTSQDRAPKFAKSPIRNFQ